MSRARLPTTATGERTSASAGAGSVQRFARPIGGPAGPIVAQAKSASHARPPGVQMATLSKAAWLDSGGEWDSTVQNGMVTAVSASKLKLAAGYQKVPSPGANAVQQNTIPWWAPLKALGLTHQTGKPNYVAMHMLNSRLGGAGIAKNLAPGTNDMNGDHSRNFEEHVIAQINAGREITQFDVVPTYHKGDGGFADPLKKQLWPLTLASLACSATAKDPNTGATTPIIQPVHELPNLNAKPNWTVQAAAMAAIPVAGAPMAALPVAAAPVAAAPVVAAPVAPAPVAPAPVAAPAFNQQVAMHQAAMNQAAMHQAQQAALQLAVVNHAQLAANQLLALAQAHNVDPAAYNNPLTVLQDMNAIGALNGVLPQFQASVLQHVHALFLQYNQAQAALAAQQAQQNAMNGPAPMVVVP